MQIGVAKVANSAWRGDNRSVQNPNQDAAQITKHPVPFPPGAWVIVTLGNPREKLWGAILSLAPEGLSLCGIEIASFDDLISLVKEGEPFSPSVVFFPMHRIERIELDLPDGNLPSLSQRFRERTGLDPSVLTRPGSSQPGRSEERR